MQVPFSNLNKQYLSIKKEIDQSILNVISESAFVRGKYVADFEKKYAASFGVRHCVSCGNGTDAIYIALKSLGIGRGDEVITTAFSWISTSEAISQTGAKVVFADIEPEFFTIDPKDVERKISSKTKAIIPVHLYGQPADMTELMLVAEKYQLKVIEDCAQAHYASYKGKKVGTFGVAGTFSFYPGKNLGAYGDAGAIISDDDDFSEHARLFANHGSLTKHNHIMEGINSRMDGLQAAVLQVKMKYINDWTEQRIRHGVKYNQLLVDNFNGSAPKIREGCKHVFHLYVIRVKERSNLQKHLQTKDISTAIHYPMALPYLDAYCHLGHQPADFPITYEYQSEVLSLPIYPELTDTMREYVVETIRKY